MAEDILKKTVQITHLEGRNKHSHMLTFFISSMANSNFCFFLGSLSCCHWRRDVSRVDCRMLVLVVLTIVSYRELSFK